MGGERRILALSKVCTNACFNYPRLKQKKGHPAGGLFYFAHLSVLTEAYSIAITT